MQGIPSRVVIGYVATTRNLFSNRLQVRFRDAHSWTEGYVEGKGWVTFDATPGPPPSGGGSDLLDFVEALDFAWYSHVVNFNGFAQKELVAGSIKFLGKLPHLNEAAWVFLSLLILAILGRVKKIKLLSWSLDPKRKLAEVRAKHYYDEMLHAFEKRGHQKPPHQTLIEFLEVLRQRAARDYHEAAVVTDVFCRSYYGQKTLTAEEQFGARIAVARLKEAPNGNDHDLKRN